MACHLRSKCERAIASRITLLRPELRTTFLKCRMHFKNTRKKELHMKEEKKRGVERTQKATRDEDWSDERLKTFLQVQPPEGLPGDYNILLRAYRGMTAELFGRFLEIFVEAGHDLNVSLDDGSTFLDLVSNHRKSTDYTALLQQLGAQPRITG